jgi:hypothetical protein
MGGNIQNTEEIIVLGTEFRTQQIELKEELVLKILKKKRIRNKNRKKERN